MKALTLWQPWSWAIAHAGKRIENRTWPPPLSAIGRRIAIHAGKRLDEEAAHKLGGLIQMPERFVHGAIEAVCIVRGWIDHAPGESTGQAQWWAGPCGWVLTDVFALPLPVPCRGAQGLWTLPAEVEDEVSRQLALNEPSLDRCLSCSDGVLDARLGGMCADCEVDHA